MRKKLLVMALMIVIAVSYTSYVWATGTEGMQVITQLSSDTIARGDNVILYASIKDETGQPIEGATVTATIGDLEILFLLPDQGNGDYQGTINTSIVKQGIYEIVITAKKEGYEPIQSLLMVTITSDGDNNPSDTDMVKFMAVVNGMRSMDVYVYVNLSNGVTKKEAELIAQAAFNQVMGDNIAHQLDTLTYNETQVQAHYTWGHDENDMGHVFEMTADLITLQITVSHCF